MPFVSNPGFLAAAFINCSAAFVLLVVYVLLAPSCPARFFRYWIAGWTLYVFTGALRISLLWNGASEVVPLRLAVGFAAALIFFFAVLECCGRRQQVSYLWPFWPFGLIGGLVIFLAARTSPQTALWTDSLAESFLFLLAGVLLWRSRKQHGGIGWEMLAGSLALLGLHGLDRADWHTQSLAVFRTSAHGLFGITAGVAMAVLVLEASRARTEQLNQKVERLALITAGATQSLRIDETLAGALRNVIAALSVTHGFVLLENSEVASGVLSLRASEGFTLRFAALCAQVPSTEPWVHEALGGSVRTFARTETASSKGLGWMEKEKLSSIALVPIPGKNAPVGLLCVGSSAPREFPTGETNFLANVANLLGLAVQNIGLIEAAATSERQLLDTLDSMDDLIFVHSPEGRILRANRSLAWHLGLEPDLVQGQSVRELLKQGDVRWNACPYCEGAAGKPEQVDPTFGGHFLVTNSDFHNSEGNCLGTVHVLKDFTERREAENKFRTLFEKVQEGIFISTPQERFVDFNDAFMRMLGYEKREDLLNADIPSEIYIDHGERQRLTRLLHEYGGVADFEFHFRRRDGEIRTALESSFVTRDESGAIVAYQGFVLDVTERKQAEMEIRRRNRELLALNAIAEILSQSPKLEEALAHALAKIAELFSADVATVYFLDEPTRTLKRAANFGYRSDYARQMGPVEVSNALLQQIRSARATLLSGAALALPEEFREVQRKEGILVAQVLVLWAKDRIIGTLVIGYREMREFSTAELNLMSAVGNQIATTIDKWHLLEQTREAYDTLRQTQEQLLQSEKMAAVGQLISGVAHELNNPLTAILGYSQLLKAEEGMSNGRSGDYLEKLYKQAQRTHHIVQNLLSFARQHKPERTAVQVNRVLEDTLALREYDLKQNRIRIHRELDPKLPQVSADFYQLQQVFLNILNNAVDALMERVPNGEIWLKTSAANGRLQIEFTDNGPGVKNPHRVFDPFYTTKPVGKGTGLGLSICYGIVKEHGGEIEVQDAPTGGATFTVTLPLSAPAASPEEASSGSRVTINQRN